MPKMTEEDFQARKEEIVTACAKLYETRNFKDITFKDIGAETTLNRSSLYNYFQTKEEIFLSLFQREYELWAADLKEISETEQEKTADRFAKRIAQSLEKRTTLLKLLSMNMYDMEENSSMNALTEFKKAYAHSMSAMRDCLVAFFPDYTEEEQQSFLYMFFPFMYGIYPYVFVTEKQDAAMKAAGMDFHAHSVYDLIYAVLAKLLRR